MLTQLLAHAAHRWNKCSFTTTVSLELLNTFSVSFGSVALELFPVIMNFADPETLDDRFKEVIEGVHAAGRRSAEAKGRTYEPKRNGLRVRKALEEAGLLRPLADHSSAAHADRVADADPAGADPADAYRGLDADRAHDADRELDDLAVDADREPVLDRGGQWLANQPYYASETESEEGFLVPEASTDAVVPPVPRTPPRGSRSRSRSPQRPLHPTALECSPTHLLRGPHSLVCERCGDGGPALWMKLSAGPDFGMTAESFAAEQVVSKGMELCYRCSASFMLDIPERFETTGKLEDTVLLKRQVAAGFVVEDDSAGAPESARPLPSRSRSWMQDEHLCVECEAELICWSCTTAEDKSLQLCSKCLAAEALRHHQKNITFKNFVEVTHRH